MEAAYWNKKWSENKIGFHQSEINKRLMNHWSAVVQNIQPKLIKVFVPLCGKSKDMLWLHRQGHPIVGVELNLEAVEAFFTENNFSAKRDCIDGFEVFTGIDAAHGITLYVGDYFALSPRHLQQCRAFYDRASLIAMPESMRRGYANQLAALMPAGAHGLLLAIAYNQSVMDGPPFSVSDEAVYDLMGKSFSIEQLARFNGPRHVGNLAERGLETLDERVYLLNRQ